MAIMKLSNVPELTEFAGTEKIYVNDNGETKQLACDKVVTAGGGGGGTKKLFVQYDCRYPLDPEEFVSALEEGCEIWVKDSPDASNFAHLTKITSFNCSGATGSTYFIAGSCIWPAESDSASGVGTPSMLAIKLCAMSSGYLERFKAALLKTS